MDDIISSMPHLPSRFASDKGNEFAQTHPAIFRILVDKYGMLIFKLGGAHKASMAERFIRTLKTRIVYRLECVPIKNGTFSHGPGLNLFQIKLGEQSSPVKILGGN